MQVEEGRVLRWSTTPVLMLLGGAKGWKMPGKWLMLFLPLSCDSNTGERHWGDRQVGHDAPQQHSVQRPKLRLRRNRIWVYHPCALGYPRHTILPTPSMSVRARSFGKVSVVMKAWAALSQEEKFDPRTRVGDVDAYDRMGSLANDAGRGAFNLH